MEYTNFAAHPHAIDIIRKDSAISADLDLSDMEHCILCFNQLRFFSLGRCGHKNVCHTCALRLRLIIKDKTCSICKTELTEVLMCQNKDISFELFEKEIRESALKDRDDEAIHFENKDVMYACIKLRSLQCLIS